MLLLPAENGISKKNPPYLTIALILVNIIAYIVLQTNDTKVFSDASEYYVQADLLEKEKSVFEDYALENRGELYQSIHNNQFLPDEYLIQLILTDKHFTQYITKLSTYSLEWRQKREKVNDTLEETSLYSYAYYPSEPSIFTAFTHMFMHGGIEHLLGNMLFLFLFGFNLELLLGRGKTFALYIVSGLAAVTFFSLTTTDKYVPLVGASGAIAGLMGGFCGWYGLKNIRYFYWLFVIFDYVKLPAALVFFYFLAKEYIMSTISDDNVAYMAHFGGLVAGFACALIFKCVLKGRDKEQVEVKVPLAQPANDLKTKYDEACLAFQQLEFDKARTLFSQLIERDPLNIDYYTKLYALEKINPSSQTFNELCNRIVLRNVKDHQFAKLTDVALGELTGNGQGLKVLPAETLIQYSSHLVKKGQLHQAKPVINFVVKHYDFNEQVPKLLFQFGLACEQSDDHMTYKKVFTYLSKKHPETFIGEEAKKALAKSS
ncbi:rhomboid family intramembrane serine protease [Kangiella sp. HD9-110m-PIT-SAG07]|nr:rhomboid family intramembrane serine protease [Kangiella sp. HD9-110m-PIT-SAG07]